MPAFLFLHNEENAEMRTKPATEINVCRFLTVTAYPQMVVLSQAAQTEY